MVFPDGYLFEPAFNQGLIKFSKVSTLLLDVVLQVVDSFNLGVSGGGVNGALPALFAELENLVGYLVVGFLVVSLFHSKIMLGNRSGKLILRAFSGGGIDVVEGVSAWQIS